MDKKRTRDGQMDSLDMARCLMLLSNYMIPINMPKKHNKNPDIFECKTCNRKFSSFQALGGHRASHKRPRLMGDQKPRSHDADGTKFFSLAINNNKTNLHECSICGREFASGQALGGHMGRHRQAAMAEDIGPVHKVAKLPVLRRLNSSKRVFGLDLNLTPLENDLEFLFGKMAPKVDRPLI